MSDLSIAVALEWMGLSISLKSKGIGSIQKFRVEGKFFGQDGEIERNFVLEKIDRKCQFCKSLRFNYWIADNEKKQKVCICPDCWEVFIA